ncbi:MAG TPA: amidohydrolase [Candidatus Polarisedimenticolia bacterium]|nr:amidohydrolase [Candidatus Polarisedimenticolia bacterium]
MNFPVRTACVFLAVLAIALSGCAPSERKESLKKADLILVNGRIHTLDPAIPDSTAVAISGDRIERVGPDAEIVKLAGPGSKKLDLQGRAVIPGLIDAHVHLMRTGESLAELDLRGLGSAAEAAAKVAEAAARTAPGDWIQGSGWDQNHWQPPEFPTTSVLDAVSASNPVVLRRVDGHALWVNQAALDAAGITRGTSDPKGGRLLRDRATGKPTGVLLDDAMPLVLDKVPTPSKETKQKWIEEAGRKFLAAGVTSVHDAGVEPEDIDLYKMMVEGGRLPVRVYAMLGGSNRKLPDYFAIAPIHGYGDRRFTFRALKLGVDGALGSRGAALLAPYSDDPKNGGLITMPAEQLEQISREALRRGYQVCVHAIGDRANRMVLDAFQGALSLVPSADPRFRIEHAQILSADDLPRLGRLGIIASMQPVHATSDMPWVPARLGPDRIAGAYAWRSLLESSARLAFGSDAPWDSRNPFDGLFAAVTRQDHSLKPEGGWLPEQRISRRAALEAFTIGGAYAAFEEKEKGTITPGKLADLVVLDRDYFEVPEAEIWKLAPEITILGGKAVYTRSGTAGDAR